MDETTSSRDFAFGVLSIAKEIYGEHAKYINKTRAIKLVCLTADELQFEGVTRGWYNFGEYSFGIDSIIKSYFATMGASLLDANLPSFELVDDGPVRRAVKDFRKQFIKRTPDFMRWIHYVIAPDPFKNFYRCHDELIDVLGNMGSSQTLIAGHPRDFVGEIITRYNTNLRHLSSERQSLFFDFTDILEELLLVARVRSLKLAHLRIYLVPMKNLYEQKIYPCLTPFEQTVHGDNKEEELKIFRGKTEGYLSAAINNIRGLNSMISEAGLKPTLDEYDIDIANGINNLSEGEMIALNGIFKTPTRPFL